MDSEPIRQAVEEAVAAVFRHRDKQSDLDRDTHTEHHQWLGQRIAKESEKAEFWRALQLKTLPWAVIALLGSVCTAVYNLMDSYVKGHWK